MLTIPGGAWAPTVPASWQNNTGFSLVNGSNLVNDQEEYQMFGRVRLAAGSGSKTFGTTNSKISWVPGSSTAFVAVATLRVGVKSTTIDLTSGPPARATIGGAAFDVYTDLIGGVDTITSSTFRSDAMTSGTPFTVNNGDLICVSLLLSVVSGVQSIKATGYGAGQSLFPAQTFVTAGPTYTTNTNLSNLILTFDDSTIGWLDGTFIASASGSETIGNTNLYGNIFNLPFQSKIDAVCGCLASGGTTNFDFGIYSDPFGTPTAVANGVISVDPQVLNNATRWVTFPLPAEITLTANTDYVLATKQNSATAITAIWYDVADAAYFQATGLGSTCYAVKSTAGASFVSQNSGKRRAGHYFRISSINAA